MTRPINIPPPGSPLVGLSPLLSHLAATANRDDSPPSGTFGSDGTFTAPPPQCSLALFQLTGPFISQSSSGWPAQPGPVWFSAPATRVEYYPADASPPNTWNTPSGQGDEATTPETATVWHNAGYQIGDSDTTRSLPATLQSTSGGGPYFYPAAGDGEWVWCFYDESAGIWQLLGGFEDIQPFELKGDLTPGGSATAYFLLPDESNVNTNVIVTVYDSPEGSQAALGRDTLNTGSSPTHGARGKAKFNHATQQWEIVCLFQQRWTYASDFHDSTSIPESSGTFTELSGLGCTVPYPGNYLVAYSLTIGNSTSGNAPPVCGCYAQPYINHNPGDVYGAAQSHFHSPQSYGGTYPWTVTIPIGAIDGTHPTAAVTLDLPPLTDADGWQWGHISDVVILPLNRNDVVTLAALSPDCAATANADMTVVYLGPT